MKGMSDYKKKRIKESVEDIKNFIDKYKRKENDESI